MITSTEKKRIKKLLGRRYVRRIQDALNQSGALNKKGMPFSRKHILRVVNGEPDKVVEKAISVLMANETKKRTPKLPFLKRLANQFLEAIQKINSND